VNTLTTLFRRVGVAAMLLVCANLSGCGGSSSAPVQTLREAAALHWQQAGLVSYRYTLRRVCFCLPEGPMQITVQGGVVSSIVDTISGLPVNPSWLGQLGTIDSLLTLAEQAERTAAVMSAHYDPTWGYPTDLYIDWLAAVADDETSYQITAFVAI
jgi:hypothetical protein